MKAKSLKGSPSRAPPSKGFNEPFVSDQVVRLVARTPDGLPQATSSHCDLPNDSSWTHVDVYVRKQTLMDASEYFNRRLTTEIGAAVPQNGNSERAEVSGIRVAAGHVAKAGQKKQKGVRTLRMRTRSCSPASASTREGTQIQEPEYPVISLEVPTIAIGTELLQYCYTKSLSDAFSSLQDLSELLLCADQYMMQDVVEECLNGLEKLLSCVCRTPRWRLASATPPECSCACLLLKLPKPLAESLAETYPRLHSILLNSVHCAARTRYPDLLTLVRDIKQFRTEPLHVVIAAISSDEFRTPSEDLLLYYVLQWVSQNTTDPASTLAAYTAILPHIRFGALSSAFLSALNRTPPFVKVVALALARRQSHGILKSPLGFQLHQDFLGFQAFRPPRPGEEKSSTITFKFLVDQVLELFQGAISEVWTDPVILRGFRFASCVSRGSSSNNLLFSIARLEENEGTLCGTLLNPVPVVVEMALRWLSHLSAPCLAHLEPGDRHSTRILTIPAQAGGSDAQNREFLQGYLSKDSLGAHFEFFVHLRVL
eukprot:TRINITY_DN7680_c0_g1_i1.p1 TRINITY_DN7680_c0_g1~~TRINITY_DN7680_c0_g1_i1.p1  ORF type:complete len:541 (-),score=38.98 TRINITY_DN7680_c0_g1_i1:323-1945(-)